MRHILPLLLKPSRYIGIEEGSVFKEPAQVKLRIGLAFPDLYEVGMSYLGQKILYSLLNAQEHWWAERVFAPCFDSARIMREQNVELCTLESDFPLAQLDALGFSITHELCYTNVLLMLDLAGIPLRSADRAKADKKYPIIMAGGGCTLAAEPLAPFIDMMMLGDGEEVVIEVMTLLELYKQENWTREQFLEKASAIAGVYVPEFFTEAPKLTAGPASSQSPALGSVQAIKGLSKIERRLVRDLNDAPYPVEQTMPFGAVHNRLALEIARGCTRGCRFCQAGMVYRPVRERKVDKMSNILEDCLNGTGYDDVSFLSLSTGDFSALKGLFLESYDRCAEDQVSISLPSLRVGSIDDSIMEKLSSIRRTGVTLAPEAGSQRLRDVINKGVTEEELIVHVQKLFEHGWQQIKLYFMIGLPSETKEDVLAIVELCRKVRDAAGPGIKRLQITAAISPFVPKPHTPFQWEKQLSLEETRERIGWLLHAFKGEKRLKMRWHEPETSFLEGIFSRGNRALAPVLETAYKKGAVFVSWREHFNLAPWLEAMQEHGLNPNDFLDERPLEASLPWSHLNTGLSQEFLLRERKNAFVEKTSPDCRYGACQVCGVCDLPNSPSGLRAAGQEVAEDKKYKNLLNLGARDQEAHKPLLDERGRVVERYAASPEGVAKAEERPAHGAKKGGKATPPAVDPALARKAVHYCITYSKKAGSVYFSQLELQTLFDQATRRAGLALSFSQGFHPLPLVSFGRALPVGVASECEVIGLHLREPISAKDAYENLNKHLPRGMQVVAVEELPINAKIPQSKSEEYLLSYIGNQHCDKLGVLDPLALDKFLKAWQDFKALPNYLWTRETKNGSRTQDIRLLVTDIQQNEDSTISICFDWSEIYVSPLRLCLEVCGFDNQAWISLTKVKQS